MNHLKAELVSKEIWLCTVRCDVPEWLVGRLTEEVNDEVSCTPFPFTKSGWRVEPTNNFIRRR